MTPSFGASLTRVDDGRKPRLAGQAIATRRTERAAGTRRQNASRHARPGRAAIARAALRPAVARARSAPRLRWTARAADRGPAVVPARPAVRVAPRGIGHASVPRFTTAVVPLLDRVSRDGAVGSAGPQSGLISAVFERDGRVVVRLRASVMVAPSREVLEAPHLCAGCQAKQRAKNDRAHQPQDYRIRSAASLPTGARNLRSLPVRSHPWPRAQECGRLANAQSRPRRTHDAQRRGALGAAISGKKRRSSRCASRARR
jgi:hypothetical protein